MNNKMGSALLVVMTVMTGLTLLLTSWWQAAGWAGDLVLVRQRYINQFYSTEVVLNYGLIWVKKEFDAVTKSLVTKSLVTKSCEKKSLVKPIVIDGGSVNLGFGVTGKSTITIDRVPGDLDERPNVVRVTATMVVDNKIVACHRCLLEHEVYETHEIKEQRFVVHHVAFGSGR